MNPRRVHKLMLDNFPAYKSVEHDWVVAVDQHGVRMLIIEKLLSDYIAGEKLVIEVHRKLGDCLARGDALRFIAEHGAEGMRISDRSFTGFVIITATGVATGWKAEPSLSRP